MHSARGCQGLHPAEELARACIERALGVPVLPYDCRCRTADSLFDLEITYGDGTTAPVEVSSDVDGKAVATLNELDKKFGEHGWRSSRLSRVWVLHTVSTPRLKALRTVGEDCLQALEALDVIQFDSARMYERVVGRGPGREPALHAQASLAQLGVLAARSYVPAADEPPGARLALHGGGGSWGGTADAVVPWIERFLAEPRRQDNLAKLRRAAQGEAHMAVFAHINNVDYAVWRALWDKDATGVVPSTIPRLPEPVTHLWLFPIPAGETGLTWAPEEGWHRFLVIPVPPPGDQCPRTLPPT